MTVRVPLGATVLIVSRHGFAAARGALSARALQALHALGRDVP